MMLLQLMLLCGLLTPRAVATADTLDTLYILEGGTADFRCLYNPEVDVAKSQDVAVSVQDCNSRQEIVRLASAVTELAAVLGETTFILRSYKTVFSPGEGATSPVFVLNSRHPLVTDGIVSLVHGNTTAIVINIRADTRVRGLCATCNQAGPTIGYTETKKSQIKIIAPPTAQLHLNGQPMGPAAADLSSVKEGDPAVIECSGSGDGALVTSLRKSGRTLASSSTERINYSVPSASPADSGLYQCHVTSDLARLVREGRETGSANFTLGVNFSPKIEIDEIIRFTPLNEREEVQVKVSAFPEPSLKCQFTANEPATTSDPSSDLVVRESYDSSKYFAQFRVTFANLDKVKNETEVTCWAENGLGNRQVRIRLTALTPVPKIVSDRDSGWWNSYRLIWQHHVRAKVDFYRIRIQYLSPTDDVVNKTEKALANVQGADVADKGIRQGKGLVFDLSPDSVHDISLQACNKHGCSGFSQSVRVRTAKQREDTFNNPQNPVFAEPQSDRKPDNAASATVASLGLLVMCSLALRASLIRFAC